MPNAVLAVVTEDSPIVPTVDLAIYKRQVEAHDLSARIHPDLTAQFSVSPPPRYLVRFIHDLDESRCRRDELYHVWRLATDGQPEGIRWRPLESVTQ